MPMSTAEKIARMLELGLNTDRQWHIRGKELQTLLEGATPSQVDTLYGMMFDH